MHRLSKTYISIGKWERQMTCGPDLDQISLLILSNALSFHPKTLFLGTVDESNQVMPQGTAMKNKEQSIHTRESKAPRTDTVCTTQGGRSPEVVVIEFAGKKIQYLVFGQ